MAARRAPTGAVGLDIRRRDGMNVLKH